MGTVTMKIKVPLITEAAMMVIINDRRRDVTTINRVIIIMVVGIVTSAMTVLRTNLEVEVVRDTLDLKKMQRITSATRSTLRD